MPPNLMRAIAVSALMANFNAVHAEESANQIIKALKPHTRGLILNGKDSTESKTIDELSAKAHERPLTSSERDKLADSTKGSAAIDLTIYFDFASFTVSSGSQGQVAALADALRSEALRNSKFLIAGHTDAVGSSEFNQKLSEDRAESVRRMLIETYHVDARTISSVGYGKEHPLPDVSPFDPKNRRVQIINLSQSTAGE